MPRNSQGEELLWLLGLTVKVIEGANVSTAWILVTVGLSEQLSWLVWSGES
jgi:hypothetical protein